MKYVLFAVLAVAAIVLLMTLIGMTLPAGHTASRKARFRQTPQALFSVISGSGEWRSSLQQVEALPSVDGRERWKEIDRRGSGITYELVESTPPLRRVTRIADDALPYAGTWTIELAPAPGGATISVTERGEVKNPIFRFISKFFTGHYQSIDLYLGDLGTRFDEQLTIE